MRTTKLLGAILGGAILAFALVIAGILVSYLTEYGSARIFAAAVAVIGGACAALLAYFAVLKHCPTRGHKRALIIIALLVILLPLVSMSWPGMVLYSRFGLTIYGLVPVPMLDITVGPRGLLWFRDKSHHISLKEVESLLAPDVEVVIIGNGWNSAVTVEDSVRRIQGREVQIVPTPEAFRLYNQCVREGRKAVLIAHSTC